MNEITTLQNIERRISHHMQGAYSNILEVGRCLIEAKESGLVPHGQWEAWVNRVAGMSERSAQRLMQAAREVSPESAMAKLFRQGDRVLHRKFGVGRVVKLIGTGSDARIEIEFTVYGVKQFALAIAPIVKLEEDE